MAGSEWKCPKGTREHERDSPSQHPASVRLSTDTRPAILLHPACQGLSFTGNVYHDTLGNRAQRDYAGVGHSGCESGRGSGMGSAAS